MSIIPYTYQLSCKWLKECHILHGLVLGNTGKKYGNLGENQYCVKFNFNDIAQKYECTYKLCDLTGQSIIGIHTNILFTLFQSDNTTQGHSWLPF